jgi:hypothetical protein
MKRQTTTLPVVAPEIENVTAIADARATKADAKAKAKNTVLANDPGLTLDLSAPTAPAPTAEQRRADAEAVRAALTPAPAPAVIIQPNIETKLKNYGRMSPVERIELAEEIRKEAQGQLKTAKATLEKELANINKMLGEPANVEQVASAPTAATKKKTGRPSAATDIVEKILAALKEGDKTKKQLDKAAGTEWIAPTLAKLQKDKQITSDGKRPATYSLK